MPHASRESRNRFLSYFRELLHDMEECEELDLDNALRLGEKKVRVPHPTLPLQLMLGSEDGYRLQLEPELTITADGRFQRSGDYLLFDPSRFFSDICGFVRVSPGESVTLGREDPLQRGLLGYPKLVANKHLRVKLSGKGLALKNKASKRGTCVAPLVETADIDRMTRWRSKKLERLAQLVGAPIEPIGRDAALDLLERTIALMEQEPYRLKTRDGDAGGVLRLPSRPTPIFVGDLHACIDNLLVILTQNGFLEAIENGSGLLIIIGDAVHPDTPGHEDEMESSMLLMDLIFRLKLRFPERVFYLRGNHDDFANDISKGGVPQGLLWEQGLHDQRGSRYRDRMRDFYDRLPYVAVSPRFVCCHAGAPTMKASKSDLIHVRDKPKLQRQLTNVQLRKPNSSSGYSASDIKRLCKAFGVSPNTPFIVGHRPLSAGDTLWLDAAGVPNHHVLFGADPHKIGVLALSNGKLLPLTYPTEPLREVYNRLVSSGRMQS